jgi:hypothetical protein
MPRTSIAEMEPKTLRRCLEKTKEISAVKICISPVENEPRTSKYTLLTHSERLPGIQARPGFVPIEMLECIIEIWLEIEDFI